MSSVGYVPLPSLRWVRPLNYCHSCLATLYGATDTRSLLLLTRINEGTWHGPTGKQYMYATKLPPHIKSVFGSIVVSTPACQATLQTANARATRVRFPAREDLFAGLFFPLLGHVDELTLYGHASPCLVRESGHRQIVRCCCIPTDEADTSMVFCRVSR